MKQIKQRDLKVGMYVVDTNCLERGDLFVVMQECTYKESLRLKLLTHDMVYNFTKDHNGLNSFGKELLYGDVPWFIPTQEEIEIIKNRYK